ncbi:MAG: cupin domain-containing protein [Acidimicrobiia bacterium]|nr:cupin domain-containing protein [Acidimicrobiia bacterium]
MLALRRTNGCAGGVQPASLPSDIATVVRDLELEPHPEGGWYRRVWASERPHRPGRERPAGTAIHYLLDAEGISRWHRITDADELWHHLAGGPLELRLSPDGIGQTSVLLGGDPATGAPAHHSVPPGCWQSARALSGPVLVMCVVTPGFVPDTFQLATEDWKPGDGTPSTVRPDWGGAPDAASPESPVN